MNSTLALVDCNNFFVSCERLFRPDLEGKPVVVLSSNDGCAVARSNEAKALGIPMGAPAFKYRDLFAQHRVVQFSANFELYSNISRRITAVLRNVTPRTEIYSIDEAFLDISALDIQDEQQWGIQLRAQIMKEVGVPVSIGIAPTKTLAKLGSEIAKKQPTHGGAVVCAGHAATQYLAETPVNDIWGIGRKLAPRLRAEGIFTAGQLANMRPQFAQQLMGIHGRQLVAELNGTMCVPFCPIGDKQKSIMRGRTFGEDTNDYAVLEAALATLTSQAVFRLRSEQQATLKASLLLETSRFKPGYRRRYYEITFSAPQQDTGHILGALADACSRMYHRGQQYHRMNVFLFDFVPAHVLQPDIFGEIDITEHAQSSKRMQAFDAINDRYGRGHIRYASEDLSSSWQPKKQLRSPRYVSAWPELPVAKLI